MKEQDILKLIQDEIKKAMTFSVPKYGDTPTDALQLTPKKYLTANSNDTEIIFNSNGVLTGDSNFTFDKSTGGSISMYAKDGLSVQNGGAVQIGGGNGGATSGTGGNLEMNGGDAIGGDSNGGAINLVAGNGHGANNGGDVNIYGGSGGATGNRGNVVIGDGTTLTNRNGDFLYIPISSGVPTGTPTSEGNFVPLVYDSTNNDFYIYNSGWKKIHLA